MGMTIDEAITRYKNNAEFERTHGNLQGCLEFRQLAEWLGKYQKIEEIVNGWGRYRKGVSSSEGDSVYMQKVSEVVKDG